MKKILVIEDEPEMRRNMVSLLHYKRYEPIEAENGRVGVETARREMPDLILCDVMMPELDGYGVLRTLQADAKLAPIPFIFLTAKREKDDLRSGMNLGADDYLTKPMGIRELMDAIEARLQRSAQKKRDAELAKASLAAIVANSPDAIIGEDLEGNIISWNPAAEVVFGYTAAEVLGRHISILATPEHPEDVLEIIERVKHGAVVRRLAVELVRKDGSHLFVSLVVCPIKDANGNLIGIAKIAHDITDIRNAQQELLHSQNQLARANENLEKTVQERTVKLQDGLSELEHFSHTITHDLRGPLRTLQGFGSLLFEEFDKRALPAETRALIARIVEAARRMDVLIMNALEYSRAARQELPLISVDPAVLIHTTIASYPNLQDRSADIQVEGILPPVLANQIGLIQCFANLFGNAVKFVRPGVLPRIRVWAERRSNFIRIWIEDNGIGIPAALRPKLFAMFQRGSREYEGTGIGLALVKKVLERMGGRAGVESEPGRGSRFWIELESARIRDSETTDRGDNG